MINPLTISLSLSLWRGACLENDADCSEEYVGPYMRLTLCLYENSHDLGALKGESALKSMTLSNFL